jgi:hydrogenase expression/formation protein HypC
MCLAIPVRVTELRGKPDGGAAPSIAVVDADGIRKEVRLDVIDRWPRVGDYVIVHAGFAIRTLDPAEAKINLGLLQELAKGPSAAAVEDGDT